MVFYSIVLNIVWVFFSCDKSSGMIFHLASRKYDKEKNGSALQ